MRFGVSGLVTVVHLCSIVTTSHVCAEPPAPTEPESQEVTSGDLALGQPVESAATNPKTSTSSAKPQPSPQSAPTVVNPALANTALVADKTGSTVVVDIRLLPKRLPYRGEQSIDGYELDERRPWWMVISGGVLFVVGYVIPMAAANERSFKDGLGFTPIPIAGPLISLAMMEECRNDIDCPSEASTRAVLLAGGVLQLAGAVLLPIGLSTSKKMWLRRDLAVGVSPAPVGRSGYGAVVNGTF